MAETTEPDPQDDPQPDPEPGTEDAPERDDPEDTEGRGQLGDAGKRALDSMKRERNAARKELTALRDKLKEHEDAGKSEVERLTEGVTEARTRAERAESNVRRWQTAMDRAPEHATLAQVRAVAKRLAGDSDDELEADADELYELLAPNPSNEDTSKSRPRKPAEKLRGGIEPDEEIEETDPRKLAQAIRGN